MCRMRPHVAVIRVLLINPILTRTEEGYVSRNGQRIGDSGNGNNRVLSWNTYDDNTVDTRRGIKLGNRLDSVDHDCCLR